MKANMKIDQVKGSIKEKIDEVKEKTVEIWHEWQEKRDQFFRTFLAAYGNHNQRFIEQGHGIDSDGEMSNGGGDSDNMTRSWSPLDKFFASRTTDETSNQKEMENSD